MLELGTSPDKFSISFRKHKILEHSKTTSCIEIGTAHGQIIKNKKHYGYYKVKEKGLKLRKLVQFEIIQKSDSKIKIVFEDLIELNFSIKNERLVISMKLQESQNSKRDYNRFTLFLSGTNGEKIYGCGEQFSVLNLKGRLIPLLTREPGLGRDNSIPSLLADLYGGAGGAWDTTYFPQPSFISSENYFIFAETYAYTEFDFRQELKHRLHFWIIPAKIFIDVKSSAPQILESLTELIGRQSPLPNWAVKGVWLGIGGGIDPQNKWSIPRKLKRAQKAGAEVSAIWAQDWSGLFKASKFDQRLFWNWEYDPQRYPKLPEYITQLNKKGIKFLGYNNCFLMKQGNLYKEAAENDLLIKTKDGLDYDIRMFSFKTGMLDLTNPNTRDWIKNIIQEKMLKIGLDGWMCDFAEYLPTDCKLFSGEDPAIYHNKYPVIWAKVNHDAVKEWKNEKKKSIVFFNRSGNFGTSKYSPLIWAGDQMVNFATHNGLPSVITAGISMGLSGIGHFHSDIGGLFAMLWLKREKEVFMRWTELSTFTPVMRTHEGHDYESRTNWTFDRDLETLNHFAKFSKIHSRLLEYTRDMLQEYQNTGLPMIRHPYLHYEEDLELHQFQYQYLYGRDLFIAPIYQKGQRKRRLFLPRDDWIHLWSNKRYKGGKIEIEAPLGKPPVFFRAGSAYYTLFEELRNI